MNLRSPAACDRADNEGPRRVARAKKGRMSSPPSPHLLSTAWRARNPIPFVRAVARAQPLPSGSSPADTSREPAPVRDLLASLGF